MPRRQPHRTRGLVAAHLGIGLLLALGAGYSPAPLTSAPPTSSTGSSAAAGDRLRLVVGGDQGRSPGGAAGAASPRTGRR